MNAESVKDEDVFPVSPCEEDEMCSGAVDDDQNAEIECKEDEEGEAQRPILCEIPEHLHQER